MKSVAYDIEYHYSVWVLLFKIEDWMKESFIQKYSQNKYELWWKLLRPWRRLGLDPRQKDLRKGESDLFSKLDCFLNIKYLGALPQGSQGYKQYLSETYCKGARKWSENRNYILVSTAWWQWRCYRLIKEARQKKHDWK